MKRKKIIGSIVAFALMLSVSACEGSVAETAAVPDVSVVADEIISNRLDTFISNPSQC